jgi:hypothetical protein
MGKGAMLAVPLLLFSFFLYKQMSKGRYAYARGDDNRELQAQCTNEEHVSHV